LADTEAVTKDEPHTVPEAAQLATVAMPNPALNWLNQRLRPQLSEKKLTNSSKNTGKAFRIWVKVVWTQNKYPLPERLYR
jgi:hypothetical protein